VHMVDMGLEFCPPRWDGKDRADACMSVETNELDAETTYSIDDRI
jgi:hypothetical protein